MPTATATGPDDRGVAVPVAVGIVVAAAVGVLVVVGLVVSLTENRLPTGPALAPPAPMAAEVTFDPATRRASFEQTSVLMPASPYTCPGKPESALPSLSSAMFCAAPVHAVYDGSNDWVATAGFGSVPDELAKATPAETAAALFESLRGQAYADHDTTVANRGSETVQLAGRPAAVQLGDLRYRVPGVPSSYDRLFVAVLPLPTGGYVAYLSGRPNDAPASTLDALNESINSLRIG